MQVIGKTMIFIKEYEGKNIYSTNISNKDINGKYTNMYINVQLPKGVEVENKTYIEITKGFLSFYKDKNGLPKVKIVVMEFQKENQETDPWTPPAEIDENTEIPPDDLPF